MQKWLLRWETCHSLMHKHISALSDTSQPVWAQHGKQCMLVFLIESYSASVVRLFDVSEIHSGALNFALVLPQLLWSLPLVAVYSPVFPAIH